MTTHTDERLVEMAREGDERSFDELVDRHLPRTFAMVARIVADREGAEDVMQNALVRAWRALGSFRGDAQFSTWLYRIALNEANRHLVRSVAHHELCYEDVMQQVPDLTADVASCAESGELRRQIEALLAGLHPDHRAAVVLRDIEGLSNEEAAELLGVEVRNFKSRLHRGRMALRRGFERLTAEVGPEVRPSAHESRHHQPGSGRT